jgi:molybdopterin molybdotransferase
LRRNRKVPLRVYRPSPFHSYKPLIYYNFEDRMGLMSVDEAIHVTVERTPPPESEIVAWADAEGRILSETVHSPWDDPAFDRSSMDGYAVRMPLGADAARFTVVERVMAGEVPRRELDYGQASKVMTGAPVPEGCDSVVPVEDCEEQGDTVVVRGPVPRGRHIRRKGENLRAGDPVFEVGRRLDHWDLAVGMVLGVSGAKVNRRLTAAILSTGSELVPVGNTPGAGQIVNSNGPMLASLWRSWGGRIKVEQTVADEEESLAQAILKGLESDYLVLSGGVSAGDKDLVPEMLTSAGVEILFHKVAIKPGKPILLGRKGRCMVIGLPGNPVSSLVGALIFWQASFAKRAGNPPPIWSRASLAEPHQSPARRRRFEPASLSEGGEVARLIAHRGSGDLPAWRFADALAELPEGIERFEAGTVVRVLPFRRPIGATD